MRMLKLFIGIALLFSPRAAYATTLLSDDFDDNTLNSTIWTTALPLSGSSIVEQNQRVEFRQRGYLITQEEFDPMSDGPLRITGTWTFGGPGGSGTDYLTMATRSDGVPGGGSGEVRNGITFLVQGEYNDVEIERRVNGIGTGLVAINDRIDVSIGDTFGFEITDDGTNISFLFEELGDPNSSVQVTTSDNTMFGENHIVFYNRETGSLGQLNEVMIEGSTQLEPTAVPEPSTLVACLIMTLCGMCFCGRRT